MTKTLKASEEKRPNHFLSIIVPAYKAEKVIGQTLTAIKEALDITKYPFEIICVVDGQVDKSFEKAKKIAKKYPGKIRVEGYQTNLGKGFAVRYGMAKAKGDIVGFMDAGPELNPEGLSILLSHFEWYNADIIVASKRHPASKVVYPWQRRILSIGYQLIVRFLFGLKVRDTQVGMKLFKREVLEKTLPRLLVKQFAFDVEMLAVANYLGYKRIYEAPVELRMKFEGGLSTIASKGFLRTSWSMFKDTAAVFYRLKILDYYNSKNRRHWITPKYLKLSHKRLAS